MTRIISLFINRVRSFLFSKLYYNFLQWPTVSSKLIGLYSFPHLSSSHHTGLPADSGASQACFCIGAFIFEGMFLHFLRSFLNYSFSVRPFLSIALNIVTPHPSTSIPSFILRHLTFSTIKVYIFTNLIYYIFTNLCTVYFP